MPDAQKATGNWQEGPTRYIGPSVLEVGLQSAGESDQLPNVIPQLVEFKQFLTCPWVHICLYGPYAHDHTPL